ncbi:MAG TPA: hypothetical protein VNA88_00300, partial [Candidatus Kapabacteria bacterium]|nr:hypothetical protein [Candidatus Kapabacteria bacterium]
DFPVVAAQSISYDDDGYLYVLVHLGSGDYATRTLRPMTPAIREPIEPPDGASGLPPYVTLRWPAVAAASGYHVQLSADPLMSRARPRGGADLHGVDLQGAALRIDDSTLTSESREVTDLTPGVTWYWRVRAKIADAWDSWSAVFRFTTAGGPGAADDHGVASTGGFRLTVVDAAAPSLRVDATHTARATLTLHALDGSRVATLVDGVLERGAHAVALPAVAGGAYVAVLTAECSSIAEIVLVP